MTRILAGIAVVLLLTSSSFAQSYCDQVRQAVATYGYTAAKQHAMAHYTKEEVRVADRCVTGESGRRGAQERASRTRTNHGAAGAHHRYRQVSASEPRADEGVAA
jgi:hypothetical protein